MDPKIAKKTQDTLGKIIKKPPLTDKLLSKPPFRFLHDITTSVVKSTGFMKGLHEESELNSENVKDKDSKIAFLQKVIDFVSLVTGKSLSAKPAKIVAGHEPEKTNELLQAIAQAINKQVDNDEYIKKFGNKDIKGEEKKDKEKDRSERKKKDEDKEERRKDRDGEGKKHREKSRDRERSKDRDGERREKDRDGERREKDRDGERSKDRDSEKRDKSKHRSDKERGHKDREKGERNKDDDKDEERRERHKDRKSKKREDEEEGKENESPEVNGEKDGRIPRPTSAKGSRRRRGDEEDKNKQGREQSESHVRETDVPPQVSAARQARPSSARPAPPRPKPDAAESEPSMRLGTGKPTNVIVDDDKQSDDDDDNFLVEDSAIPPPEPEQPAPKPDNEDDEDHGGLVKKMLETKKELEQPNQPLKKVDIERSAMSDAARRKQREHVQKEIDKLRSSIQSLTRSANPLGKIMDYVQEDLDSMQKELEKWKSENKEHALALKREKGVTDRAIEPLKAQLSDIDQAIKDQLDASAAVKANIIKNDQKIEKMLKSIARS
ncbi:TRAF3-interacting protein 1 isoform X2 [Patella vulgata]|uniref:TRAF3-interacting protein 1 isoform X2 n=1 Tax=Patella vulgata TaxID=6465 RepID=UPI0024A9F6A9|nr:TRAF3-interacting protein 1 isoform X2 [Patella vulgata]